ncbi:tetratricopeptide repeat protein [Oculatella sp. LEGE 06141]|uniref:tetratricopeptide repeat protein n=1 Tax=Oculatella sp. LEGE 06141 TaxID=1828648 RepID=UPI001881CCC0|nr:tetratricopeptide repeat protein [Oculatella sp. LEGE 06141]MBE9179742.1 tetratricopeptide repeat protein [Oculatella sp. LEGE 06141]
MHDAFYRQGVEKAEQKDYKAAVAEFDQALLLNPTFVEAYYRRGLARFKLGEFRWAIADYTATLRLDSNHFNAYYARSLAYIAFGNLNDASADAKKAILLKPTHALTYNLLGTIRRQQGETAKAISCYRKAAELYLDAQDLTNARHCLTTIRQLQAPATPEPDAQPSPPTLPPINNEEFLQQAIEKARRGYFHSAIEDLDWALQIDPQDASAYASRGKVRAELHDWRGAIDDYQQAANLFQKQAEPSMAQQMLDTIYQLKAAQVRIATTGDRTVSAVPQSSSRRMVAGTPSQKVQNKLRRLVGDDRRIVIGLVERLKQKHPNRPEDWYWEKAIYDLERDRW